MYQHKVHYYWESGWPDDYVAGCHIDLYHKVSSKWQNVTCKHCLKRQAMWLNNR